MKKRLLALLTALAMVLCCASVMAETTTVTTGTATVQGFGGDITVTVTLDGDNIKDVTITGDGETEGIGKKIIDEWPNAFIEYNGIVDTYTGATFAGITREAVIAAMRQALENAGVNPDDFMREMETEEALDVVIDSDIVIIGAGGAGMTAALTASDAGKNVLVLESQPAVGGNSVKSTGGMNAAKTTYQDNNTFDEAAGIEKTLKAAEAYADNEAITALAATVKEQWEAWQANPEGYFDSTELFALDTLIGGKGLNNPDLVNTLVNDSAAAIDWLSSIGIDLNNVAAFGGASVKRIHRPVNAEGKVVSVGAYTVPLLEKASQERDNITLLTDTTATQILTNEAGAACGIVATGKSGNTVTVNAKAAILEIPADAFAETMNTWNGYVAEKNDPEFGRTSFAQPLDTAPFYAVKVTAGIHHTMGGLKIDEKTHVLNTDGQIIPGLFAAGEVTGGVHGGNRLGGNAVADIVVFGRIAGAQAAEYAK